MPDSGSQLIPIILWQGSLYSHLHRDDDFKLGGRFSGVFLIPSKSLPKCPVITNNLPFHCILKASLVIKVPSSSRITWGVFGSALQAST